MGYQGTRRKSGRISRFVAKEKQAGGGAESEIWPKWPWKVSVLSRSCGVSALWRLELALPQRPGLRDPPTLTSSLWVERGCPKEPGMPPLCHYWTELLL